MGCGASVPVDDDEIDLFLQDKRINDAIEQSLQLRQQNSKRESSCCCWVLVKVVNQQF